MYKYAFPKFGAKFSGFLGYPDPRQKKGVPRFVQAFVGMWVYEASESLTLRGECSKRDKGFKGWRVKKNSPYRKTSVYLSYSPPEGHGNSIHCPPVILHLPDWCKRSPSPDLTWNQRNISSLPVWDVAMLPFRSIRKQLQTKGLSASISSNIWLRFWFLTRSNDSASLGDARTQAKILQTG